VANLYFQEFMARWLQVGVAENKEVAALKAWPNPACETLIVGCGQQHVGALLVITDMQGREVLRRTVTAEREVLNTDMLAPGMYQVTLQSATARASARVVVTR
jgi:hypothetical protein